MPLLAISLILMVVSTVITAFLVKRPKIKPAALEDIEFPQADDGTPQVEVFGDVWLSGPMVLWYGNFRTAKIKSGGK